MNDETKYIRELLAISIINLTSVFGNEKCRESADSFVRKFIRGTETENFIQLPKKLEDLFKNNLSDEDMNVVIEGFETYVCSLEDSDKKTKLKEVIDAMKDNNDHITYDPSIEDEMYIIVLAIYNSSESSVILNLVKYLTSYEKLNTKIYEAPFLNEVVNFINSISFPEYDQGTSSDDALSAFLRSKETGTVGENPDKTTLEQNIESFKSDVAKIDIVNADTNLIALGVEGIALGVESVALQFKEDMAETGKPTEDDLIRNIIQKTLVVTNTARRGIKNNRDIKDIILDSFNRLGEHETIVRDSRVLEGKVQQVEDENDVEKLEEKIVSVVSEKANEVLKHETIEETKTENKQGKDDNVDGKDSLQDEYYNILHRYKNITKR